MPKRADHRRAVYAIAVSCAGCHAAAAAVPPQLAGMCPGPAWQHVSLAPPAAAAGLMDEPCAPAFFDEQELEKIGRPAAKARACLTGLPAGSRVPQASAPQGPLQLMRPAYDTARIPPTAGVMARRASRSRADLTLVSPGWRRLASSPSTAWPPCPGMQRAGSPTPAPASEAWPSSVSS